MRFRYLIVSAVALVVLPSGWLGAINVIAYHDRTGDEHQALFEDLSEENYRMISLSVYDSPPRYAAVWVEEPGPAYIGFHGLGVDEYVMRSSRG